MMTPASWDPMTSNPVRCPVAGSGQCSSPLLIAIVLRAGIRSAKVVGRASISIMMNRLRTSTNRVVATYAEWRHEE